MYNISMINISLLFNEYTSGLLILFSLNIYCVLIFCNKKNITGIISIKPIKTNSWRSYPISGMFFWPATEAVGSVCQAYEYRIFLVENPTKNTTVQQKVLQIIFVQMFFDFVHV